jgi:CheY-like chemotaxis protein
MAQKILVIDDESEMCDLVTEMLECLGYEVESALNGKAGLERLGESDFDAVIIDLWMPVMDGVSTIVAIRKANKTVPIIVMTGYSEKVNLIGSAKRLGATQILDKPFGLETLKTVIGGAIAGNKLLHP